MQKRLCELRDDREAARSRLLDAPPPDPPTAAAATTLPTAEPAGASADAPFQLLARAAMEVDSTATQLTAAGGATQPNAATQPGPIPLEQATEQQAVLRQAAAQQQTINHNWDVYHCLVSQKKDWAEQVAEGTKQLQVPKQLPPNGGGLEAVAARGGKKKVARAAASNGTTPPAAAKPTYPKGWFTLSGLRGLLAEHSLEAAAQEQGAVKVPSMQQLLKDRVPAKFGECPIMAPKGRAPAAPAADVAAEVAAAADSITQLPAVINVAVEESGGVGQQGVEEVVAQEEGVGEDMQVEEEGGVQCPPCEAAATGEAGSSAAGAAERGAAHALKLLQDKVRAANKARMVARKQLTELSDVLRNHYYRTCKYMGSLHGATDEERARKGWVFWLRGLEGHVLDRDHRYCGADAKCRQTGYEERKPLNEVGVTLFRCFIESDAMKERLCKCCHNAHTWDAESQAALYHVYAMKRVVCKYFAEAYAHISKFSRNEGLVARMLQLNNPYTEKVARSGARRLAHHDKPVFEKNLTARTQHWQGEVEQRLYRAIVDPNAQFPSSGWHALRPALAVVQPIEVPPQVPELLQELARPAAADVAAEGEPMEIDGEAAAAGDEAPTVSPDAAAVVVREHGRITLYRLQELQGAAQREQPPSLTPATPRSSHSLRCAACGLGLQAKLAVGVSEVRCPHCASEFAVTVNPDPAQYSKAAKAERKVASKAPRQDPLPPRAERPFNLFMSTEVRMP